MVIDFDHLVGPLVEADGHDAPWLVGEAVPGIAAGLDDGVVVGEDAIGEMGLAQVLPDVLDRVEPVIAAAAEPG
jgi:hypothetical protein